MRKRVTNDGRLVVDLRFVAIVTTNVTNGGRISFGFPNRIGHGIDFVDDDVTLLGAFYDPDSPPV